MDSLNKENLENVKSYLSRFSDKDFSIFITKKILELSDSEIATTQFAFWICYEIEQTLDNFLLFFLSLLLLALKELAIFSKKHKELN
ncbi:MAG: hypothetical protein PHI91_03305 [Candidatus Pacebacteria bacterium]|nr:hypothetical protein [Candidatus Paceibacterota bacterium]MDD2757639.1 hypothetical protein [Candidatus Paceibacterota bacterium]MDD3283812.1 hypothetical protein [Candidatus Paceibacterota bacterium]MDD3970187.1 hypothetical protein [Candidatus Paceibacterota bacterium]MDD4738265.1 hypothetical protein [Candidatus Paceibacterota bacterium]